LGIACTYERALRRTDVIGPDIESTDRGSAKPLILLDFSVIIFSLHFSYITYIGYQQRNSSIYGRYYQDETDTNNEGDISKTGGLLGQENHFQDGELKMAVDKSEVVVLGPVSFVADYFRNGSKARTTPFNYTASGAFGASFFTFPDRSKTILQGTCHSGSSPIQECAAGSSTQTVVPQCRPRSAGSGTGTHHRNIGRFALS
jgi:hypothetical protein